MVAVGEVREYGGKLKVRILGSRDMFFGGSF